MHFQRTETINDPDKVAALRAQLAGAPPFASYTHHGADHAPVMFELYRSAKDNVMERPVATATRQDDGSFNIVEALPLKGRKS